jgi:gamma-glutamylaminecyclotransferase
MTQATATIAQLFVYGSLKRGARHHAELRGAAFLGEARTAAGYALEAIGEYLVLVEQPGPGSVRGELFQVAEPLLQLLDEFEGEDYCRGVIRLAVGDSTRMEDSARNCLALAYVKRTR